MSDIFYEVLMEKRAGKISDFFSRINPFSRRAALSDAVAAAQKDSAGQEAARRAGLAEAVMVPRGNPLQLEYLPDVDQAGLLARERAARDALAAHREAALSKAEEMQLPVLARRTDVEHKRGYGGEGKSNLKRNLLIGSGLLAAGGGAYAYNRDRKKRSRRD